jgi:hypothetical protein
MRKLSSLSLNLKYYTKLMLKEQHKFIHNIGFFYIDQVRHFEKERFAKDYQEIYF